MNQPKKSISYSSSGVNYQSLDLLKRLSQTKAKSTAPYLQSTSVGEVGASRGESAYVWEETDGYRAFVIEGLGTKNLIADEMRKITGKTYYDVVAQDTVAMIINDLIVVGAEPQVINAYFGLGNSEWIHDEQRTTDLVQGWAKGCELAGVTWGGGETPGLAGVINPETVDLCGAAVGVIKPKNRLTLGDKLREGDVLILVESSGIHANGISLARAIANQLPERYATPLKDGTLFGDAILKPTYLYSKMVKGLFEAGIDIHYMVNVTGHGWRKLMRATQDYRYVLTDIPTPQPLFDFIQQHSGNSTEEMYGNFNMGAGFAIYIPENQAAQTQEVIKKQGFASWKAGRVEEGEKEVVIKPLGISFKGNTLKVRS
ncbi:phosphoribosylformylglycinamidine cyclo-ligase [Candidatus Roizmanbacteria bacterium]|nr:phosphoribosylformylglycinamidine cyclo-ligase [Candidatus Roizmanbacteria bacterium]